MPLDHAVASPGLTPPLAKPKGAHPCDPPLGLDLALLGAVQSIRDLLYAGFATLDGAVPVVEAHPGLAANVVRVATLGPEATHLPGPHSVASAVYWLGLLNLNRIAELTWVRSLVAFDEPILRGVGEQVWRHTVARAAALRLMAALDGGQEGPDPALAHTAGALADVGLLLELRGLARPGLSEHGFLVEVQRLVSDGCHATRGARLLHGWGFNTVVATFAEHHHHPDVVAERFRWPLAPAAIALANELERAPDAALTVVTGSAADHRWLLPTLSSEIATIAECIH